MFKTLDDGSLDVTKTTRTVVRELIVDRIPYTVVNIIHSTDVSSLLCRDSIVKAMRSRSNLSPENSFLGKDKSYE